MAQDKLKLVDIYPKQIVQIQIGADNRLWINVDGGVCVLRTIGAPIDIDDQRKV